MTPPRRESYTLIQTGSVSEVTDSDGDLVAEYCYDPYSSHKLQGVEDS